MKVDVRQLNMFQKRLATVKRQLLQLKRLSRTPLSPNTNIAAVRGLNTELARPLRLARQIQNQGPIRVRRAGGAGGRGGGRARGGGVGPAGFFGGAAAAGGVGRTGLVGRSFVGGFGIALVVRQLFNATAAMEGIEVALGAVTREGQTTADVMTFLRGEADRLGFDFATSALEYAKLAAAGNALGLETAQIEEIFISAQEAARVFNLSVADTEGVLKAFTQIISKGKVTAEELRNQLGDRLPAAVPIFARALGVTTQELGQMLEKGEILAKTALPLFAKELRATFAKQIPAASRSLTAVLNRTKTALFEFSAALGKSGLSKIFIDALKVVTKLFVLLGPPIKFLITTINILLIPFRALGRIFGMVIDRMPAVTAAFIALNIALFATKVGLFRIAAAWVIAFAPVIATAAAIAAMVLLFEDWIVAIEGGDSIIGRMADSTNVFMSVIGGSLINLGKFVQFLGELVAAIVTGDFDELTESMKRFFRTIDNFIFGSSRQKFVDFLETIAGVFGDTPDEIAVRALASTQLRPGSPGALAGGGGSEVQVTIIDGAGLVDRVETVQEGTFRQAQADFPDNE